MSTIPQQHLHTADFQPRRRLTNGHLQTIFGNYLPREDRLPPPEAELVEVSPATDDQMSSQVLCHCHWQPAEVRATRPTAIIVHGLEGSSNSQYVDVRQQQQAGYRLAGCNIIRMNMLQLRRHRGPHPHPVPHPASPPTS